MFWSRQKVRHIRQGVQDQQPATMVDAAAEGPAEPAPGPSAAAMSEHATTGSESPAALEGPPVVQQPADHSSPFPASHPSRQQQQQQRPRKSCLKKPSHPNATSQRQEQQGHRSAEEEEEDVAVQQQSESDFYSPNIARICGRSASSCGYCKGSRAWVLDVDNPDPATAGASGASDEESGAAGRGNRASGNTVDGTSGEDRDNMTNEAAKGEGKNEDMDGSMTTSSAAVVSATSSALNGPAPADRPAVSSNNASKSSSCSTSYGLLFSTLSSSSYQKLLDLGWRRSGNHLYKPDNWVSCCPALSIRLDVRKYKRSRGQKRVGKRLERYLAGGSRSGHEYENSNIGGGASIEGGVFQAKIGKNGKKGVGRKDANSCAPSEAERMVEQSQLLDRLRYETMKATKAFSSAQMLGLDHEELYKLCAFKLTKQSIPKDVMQTLRATNGDNSCNDSTSSIIAASTSICPAMGGRSKGKIDRVAMSQCVVQALTKAMIVWEEGSNPNGGDGSGGDIKVLSIMANKGGRINVYLRVNTGSGKKNDDESMDDAASQMEIDSPVQAESQDWTQSSNDDVIGDFLRKTRLEMLESYRQQQNGLSSDTNAVSSGPYTLTVRSVPAHISASQPEVHRLFAKYQTAIHGDADPFAPVSDDVVESNDKKSSSSSTTKKTNISSGGEDGDVAMNGSQSLDVDDHGMKDDDDSDDLDGPLSDDDEDDEESSWREDIYDVDKVYAHMNSRSRSRIKKGYVHFHRFLCETPLPPVKPRGKDDGRFRLDEEGYDTHIPLGTYHQQYRINGVLIAVGVIDILPHCLSSVYAFYDPVLSRHLELGKYTALREIEWVKRACIHRTDLTYYYLGYYIRSCTKMVYKAEYKPSELLCPTSDKWVDFEIAKKRLDTLSPVRHCCALHVEDKDGEDASSSTSRYTERHKTALVESMMLDIGGGVDGEQGPPVTVGMLNRQGRKIVDPLVQEFIDEVGFDVSRRCVIRLS